MFKAAQIIFAMVRDWILNFVILICSPWRIVVCVLKAKQLMK